MNPVGSIQPLLVSADDGCLSDTINTQHPIWTRTLPKPEVQSEHRGPGKINAAALQCFGQGEIRTKAITQVIEVSRRDAIQGMQKLREVFRAR